MLLDFVRGSVPEAPAKRSGYTLRRAGRGSGKTLRPTSQPRSCFADGVNAATVKPEPVQFFLEDGEIRNWISIERDIIEHALAYYSGNVSRAARDLKVGRSTIYHRLGRF